MSLFPLNGTIPTFAERLSDVTYVKQFFTHWELLIFLAWLPIYLIIGRISFWLTFVPTYGFKFRLQNQLIDVDNKAVAITLASFMVAQGLVFLGAMSDWTTPSETRAWTSIVWSLIGLFVIIVSEFVNDLLLHHRIRYKTEIVERKNIAVATVNGALLISTGIFVRYLVAGSVENWGYALLSLLILWAMSQIFFIINVHVYDILHWKTSIQGELLLDNRTVGLSVGGCMLAMAIIISSPIERSESVLALLFWFLIATVVLPLLVLVANFVFAPNPLTSGRPCWGLGAVEGAFLISFAFASRSFITFNRCGANPLPWTRRIVDLNFAVSIFEWYNLIFIVAVVGVLLLSRGIYQLVDILVAIRERTGVGYAVRHFLRVRRRDMKDEDELTDENNASTTELVEVPPVESASAEGDGPKSWYSSAQSLKFAGYLVGLALVMQGALRGSVNPGLSWYLVLGYFFVWAGIGSICVALAFFITRFFLWRLVPNTARENVAASLVHGAGYVATGLVVGAPLGSMVGGDRSINSNDSAYVWDEDVATVAIFFAIELVLMLIAGFLYHLWTPYNDVKEVKKGNPAVGVSAALTWIALGIIAAAPITLSDSVPAAVLFFPFGAVVLAIMRVVTSVAIIGGMRLSEEISKDANYGAAFIEGGTAIATAFVLSGFLPDRCTIIPPTIIG